MKMFKSDNTSGVHEKVLKAMSEVNFQHDYAYGTDATTKKAIEKFSELFGKNVDVYFVTTGTAANVIGLSGLLRPFEAVVSVDSAHINVDECGALENFSGSKIIYVPNNDGKLSIKDVKPLLSVVGDEHNSQPKVISISQTTELGTLYTLDEIKEMAEFAHSNGMYLHMDGARISNAVVALNTTFKEMVTDTGVDILSFGGTKNGMMIGEAIVLLNESISPNYKFYRKQGMQLLSKMRFISAQFLAYLEEDVWKNNAENSNNMGRYMKERLMEFENIRLKSDFKTNMIFAYMEKGLIEHLLKSFGFYVIDEKEGLIRLVMSFDTTKDDIDNFIDGIVDYYNVK